MRPVAALFDLDGTLIDSIRLILDSYHHTIEVHGKEPQEDAFFLRGVGTPLRVQLAQFAADETELDALVSTYRKWNLAEHDGRVAAYPGVRESLEQLAGDGVRLGVVTSKAHASARRGLDVAGLAHLDFEVLIGADDVERHKPDPLPVLRALEHLAVAPSQAVYVGDSPHDMQSGRAAGVFTAAALWGPFEREALAPTAPDQWLVETSALAALEAR